MPRPGEATRLSCLISEEREEAGIVRAGQALAHCRPSSVLAGHLTWTGGSACFLLSVPVLNKLYSDKNTALLNTQVISGKRDIIMKTKLQVQLLLTTWHELATVPVVKNFNKQKLHITGIKHEGGRKTFKGCNHENQSLIWRILTNQNHHCYIKHTNGHIQKL